MSEPQLKASSGRKGVTSAKYVGFFKHKATRATGVVTLLVMVCAGVSALVAQQFQQRTVVFDMKGTIDLFMQQSAQKQLDANSARAITVRFDHALKESLSAWEHEHDDLILVPPAVVIPVVNITPQIQADIARRMQEAQ